MPDFNAVVTQRFEVSPGLIILRVAPQGWSLNEFKPGQFGVLGLPGAAARCTFSQPEDENAAPEKWILRAYSIASSSKQKEYLEFYVTLVSSGALTPRLFALEAGSKVYLSQKITGMFTLNEVPEDAHIVMIGTGTGLAPYMSMLRTHLICGGPRRFAILHGARHSWDLGYQSELSMMQTFCNNFTYCPVISRPKEEHVEWKGEVGYVQELWSRGILEKEWGFKPTPKDTHIFLCGNPSMIEDAMTLLTADGFVEHKKNQPGHVHVERYW